MASLSNSPNDPETGRFGPATVALLTDFGPGSLFAGILHGVILGADPEVRILDLAHDIPPQNVAAAALALEAAADYFPRPTVFCCVVDPGVGSERRALVARDGHHVYVAPDNGLLTFVEDLAREDGRQWTVGALDPARFDGERPRSATFHGRDVFALAAADWTRIGRTESPRPPLRSLATPVSTWERLDPPAPSLDSTGRVLTIHCLAVDSFGNAITTLRRRDWVRVWGEASAASREAPPDDHRRIETRLGDARWDSISRTYADVELGHPLSYWGSGGRLEIAVRNGNAAARFSIVQGTPLDLVWEG